MRKLETKEFLDRRKIRNQWIVGVVMIGLLVLSTAGFSLMSQEEGDASRVEEKGLTFYRSEGVWVTTIGDQTFYFENLPSEVENISINDSLDLGGYSNQVVYLVNPTVSSGPILNNLERYLLRFQEACLNGTNCSNEALPEKNCDEHVLVFEESDEEGIEVVDSCVFIKGHGSRVGDAFVYEVLNINGFKDYYG